MAPEHLLLIGQWGAHQPLFGAGMPTSVLQLWVPRVELHLFYNAAVLVPMCVAMILDPPAWRTGTARAEKTAAT